MSKQLTEYHRKPWGGKFGYTPRLGWSAQLCRGPEPGISHVVVQRIHAGQSSSVGLSLTDITRQELAKKIRQARKVIHDAMRGQQP